jgi:hypothetical protein
MSHETSEKLPYGKQYDDRAQESSLRARPGASRSMTTATNKFASLPTGGLRAHAGPKGRMAEREGFEPSVPLLGVHTISSRAPSTARSPLHSHLTSKWKHRARESFATCAVDQGSVSTQHRRSKAFPVCWLIEIIILFSTFLETLQRFRRVKVRYRLPRLLPHSWRAC